MRQGFVLLAALWLMLALSSTSLVYGVAARIDRKIGITGLQRDQARYALEACLADVRTTVEDSIRSTLHANSAISHLGHWQAHTLLPQRPFADEIGYVAWIENPAARVNLITANPESLERLATSVLGGLSASISAANQMRAWQSLQQFAITSTFASSIGHSRMVYEAFDGDTLLAGAFEDKLTVFGDGRIDLRAASEEVLQSIRGITEDAAKGIVSARAATNYPLDLSAVAMQLPGSAAMQLMANLPEINNATTSYTTVLMIYCEAQINEERLGRAEALLHAAADGIRLDWVRWE